METILIPSKAIVSQQSPAENQFSEDVAKPTPSGVSMARYLERSEESPVESPKGSSAEAELARQSVAKGPIIYGFRYLDTDRVHE